MNNEAYFNELSLNDKPDDIKVSDCLKECRRFLKSNGFNVCRARHQDISALISYIPTISGIKSERDAYNYILSFFRSPFEENVTDEEEDVFLSKNLYYKGDAVDGLHWAQLHETLSLSLRTNDEWDTDIIHVADELNNVYKVRNVSTEQNALKHCEWIESIQDIVLTPTTIIPEDKKKKLREDHGRDKLEEFWKSLRNCEYVVQCINSLPFNREEPNLIRKVFPDGRIEIVLHWEDDGYGMVIQTTGKTFRETSRIAEIIQEKYDR